MGTSRYCCSLITLIKNFQVILTCKWGYKKDWNKTLSTEWENLIYTAIKEIFFRKSQLTKFCIAHEKFSAVQVRQYEVCWKWYFPTWLLACHQSDPISDKFLLKYLLKGSSRYRISNLCASLSLARSPTLMIRDLSYLTTKLKFYILVRSVRFVLFKNCLN